MAMQFIDSFDHYDTEHILEKWYSYSAVEITSDASRRSGGQGAKISSGGFLKKGFFAYEFPPGEEVGSSSFGILIAVRFPDGGGGDDTPLFRAFFPGTSPPNQNKNYAMYLASNGGLYFKREDLPEPNTSQIYTVNDNGEEFNILDGEFHHIAVTLGVAFDQNSIQYSFTLYVDEVFVAPPNLPFEEAPFVIGEAFVTIFSPNMLLHLDDVIIRSGGSPPLEQGTASLLDHQNLMIVALKPNEVGSANNEFVAESPHWDAINDIIPPNEGALTTEQSNLDDWDIEDLSLSVGRWVVCQAVARLKSSGASTLHTFIIDTDNNPDVTQPSHILPVPGLKPSHTYDHVVNSPQYKFYRWVHNGDNNIDPFGGLFRNQVIFLNDVILGLRTIANSGELSIDQFVLEIAIPFVPDNPPPLPLSIEPWTYGRFTKLWKVVRPDGLTFRFTNHNIDLINPDDGLTYTPIDSLLTSAHQRKTGLDPNNSEILGAFGTLSYNDFLAGKYNGTRITEFILDWMYPWAGIFLTTTFYIDSTEFDAAKWTVSTSGLALPLLRPKGHVYGRTCRYVLGDSSCKVDLAPLAQSASVLEVGINDHTRFITFDLTQTTDPIGNPRGVSGYWAFGNLSWTSGLNVGIRSEVKSQTIQVILEYSEFVLQIPTPFPIVAGDLFTVTPGCDKVLSTCRDKFQNPTDGDIDIGNLKNYGGFPTIPGKDGIFTPLSEAKRVLSFGDIFDNPILGIVGDILF